MPIGKQSCRMPYINYPIRFVHDFETGQNPTGLESSRTYAEGYPVGYADDNPVHVGCIYCRIRVRF